MSIPATMNTSDRNIRLLRSRTISLPHQKNRSIASIARPPGPTIRPACWHMCPASPCSCPRAMHSGDATGTNAPVRRKTILRQAAWGCATAGASFCWNGHAKEYELAVRGPEGLPFYGDDNPFTVSAKYIDILAKIMTDEVVFHRMTPQDHLLTHHDPFRVWCLAESASSISCFPVPANRFWVHVAEGELRGQCVDRCQDRRATPVPRVGSRAKVKSPQMPRMNAV